MERVDERFIVPVAHALVCERDLNLKCGPRELCLSSRMSGVSTEKITTDDLAAVLKREGVGPFSKSEFVAISKEPVEPISAKSEVDTEHVSSGKCSKSEIMKTETRCFSESPALLLPGPGKHFHDDWSAHQTNDVDIFGSSTDFGPSCGKQAVSAYSMEADETDMVDVPHKLPQSNFDGHQTGPSVFSFYRNRYPTYYSSIRRDGRQGVQRVAKEAARFQETTGVPSYLFPSTTRNPFESADAAELISNCAPDSLERREDSLRYAWPTASNSVAMPLTRQSLDALAMKTAVTRNSFCVPANYSFVASQFHRASDLLEVKERCRRIAARGAGSRSRELNPTRRDELIFETGQGYLSVSESDAESVAGSVRSDVAMVSGHVNPDLGFELKREAMKAVGASERDIRWNTSHKSQEAIAAEQAQRRRKRNRDRMRRRERIMKAKGVHAQEPAAEQRLRAANTQKRITRKLIYLQKARDQGKLSNSRFELRKDEILYSLMSKPDVPQRCGSVSDDVFISVKRKRRREAPTIPLAQCTPPPRSSSPGVEEVQNSGAESETLFAPKLSNTKEEQMRLMRLLDQRAPPKHRFFGTDTSPLDRVMRSREESSFASWEDEQSIPDVERPDWMRESSRQLKLFRK